MELATPVVTRNIVLVGNPNSGKSTLFNVLTGLNARVGNYSGVTVERKEGTLIGSAANAAVTVVDLPGAYSLCPQSIDEKISRDALLNHLADSIPPTLVVVVIDALNLERGLYYASQLIELGYPLILALNKIDMISSKGMEINLPRLRELLGVPILPVSAHSKMGIQPLLAQITELLESDSPPRFKWFCRLPRLYWLQIVKIARMLQSGRPRQKHRAEAEAMTLLSDENLLKNTDLSLNYSPEVIASVHEARRTLQSDNKEWNRLVIQSRNDFTAKIYAETVSVHHDRVGEITDQWDHYLTHHIWGYAVFLLIIAIVFNGIFFLAQLPMQWLKEIVEHTGNFISRIIPPGPLESLLENGVVAGVGSVVVFLPQICLLFFFICLLEESGYMARAAFLMDKVMGRVGLAGKSFIPMLSSFACAIPGIMSARTMDRSTDRLMTVMIAPFMACSARLPIYTLIIATTIPDVTWLGFIHLHGLILLGLYCLGIVGALLAAWFLRRTLIKSTPPLMVMELPAYRWPSARAIGRNVWERAWMFIVKAGTLILGINILLWFLVTYPHAPKPDASGSGNQSNAGEAIAQSYAGRLGKVIEPAIAPLGMDWRIGIAIISSFAAREVFISTLSIIYNVEDDKTHTHNQQALSLSLQQQKRPNGLDVYTPLLGLSILMFYVFAMQCVSTMVVVYRETNSWRWPVIQWLIMGAMAWISSFIVYQGGRLLGFS